MRLRTTLELNSTLLKNMIKKELSKIVEGNRKVFKGAK